ncbi:MAG: nitronate monooxygenase [Actinomycetota bacterium]|nr:nitronate monooxygenase [Actinomycetota bacterium]
MIVDELSCPIVLAPLGGGPFTPSLAAAVSEAGGLGFVAAGYLSVDAMVDALAATLDLTDRPIGVNLFVPGRPTPPEVFRRYAAGLRDDAERVGAQLGDPRFDDDGWQSKLEVLTVEPVPVVSFTFGCPSAEEITGLHGVGSEVWVTVTDIEEAAAALAAGADVLVAQGSEAGGHRSTFVDDADDAVDGLSLLTLLQLLRPAVAAPVVATGGIATGAAVAAVLAAGATAAQVGTAFLRCPEAGTSPVHRRMLADATPTITTRAFTGRLARGIRNRFIDDHNHDAPVAYPEVHYLTAPLRQAGRVAGDADVVNLWAGQAYALARELPAAEVVRMLTADARLAIAGIARRFGD